MFHRCHRCRSASARVAVACEDRGCARTSPEPSTNRLAIRRCYVGFVHYPRAGPAYALYFDQRTPGRTAMIQNTIAPVDQLWLSVRREAEAILANDPAVRHLAVGRDSRSSRFWQRARPPDRRTARQTCGRPRTIRPHCPRGICRRAGSDRGREPGSAKHCRSRSRDGAAAAAAPELQGLRCTAGLARLQLALARESHRSCLVAAEPVVRLPAGQHPSLRLDRHVGVSRSCDRHHCRCIRRRSATR